MKKYISPQGYISIYNSRLYGNDPVLEHRIIAESVLGRELPSGASIHHANGNRTDNRKENLVICESLSYHNLLHQRMDALLSCGNANWRKCRFCKEYDDPENLYIHGSNVHHRRCFNIDQSYRKALKRRLHDRGRQNKA